ncbi:hypothetical protein jhhlp_005963 [Lomentospora prolificans]|uniref:SH3 domain-containing protein n=1 Tax=Lomentospora prolificans TaxID=41688 RepID=A0A2N3N4K0_9PEZI|nr:hypothetical protein jhhlp_005963 [Lomentospora prolificans]
MDHLIHVRQRRRQMEAKKLALRQKDDDDEETPKKGPVTVVRTKYRTLSATFTGEVGGYTTVGKDDSTKKTTTTKERAVTTTSPKATPTTIEETEEPDETDLSTKTTLAIAPDADRGLSTSAVGTQLPIASESSSSNASSGGASAGAKAGIAIGVIAGILLLAGLVFFFVKRKKKQAERQSLEDDEKLHGAFSPANYTPTAAAAVTAASVASSPVTYGNLNEKHVAGAAAGAGAFNRNQPQRQPQPQHQPTRSGGSGWERPMTSQSQNPSNPFGPHAELPGSQPPSPSSGAPIAAAAVAGAAAGAAAAHGVQRQTSRNHGPRALDLTIAPPPPLQAVPPSPAGTEYSMNSVTSGQQVPASTGAAAIAAAGGPASSTVHRVQLDFKPTLEDELDLKAGQLVRLLHEYDDGWALCIRLDRSRQGVVPRTCLSTRPVKPRAPGGPNGQQRMGPPVNPSGRPMTPQNGGPAPLQIRPESPAHPGTPNGPNYPQQQQSPGPRYQPMPPPQRSGTPNSMGGRSSPAIPRTMSPAPGPLSAPIPASMAAPAPAPAPAPASPVQAPVPAPVAAPAPAPVAATPAAPLAEVAEVPSAVPTPSASPSLPPVLAPIPLSAPLSAPTAPAEVAPQPVTSPAPSVSSTVSPASPRPGPPSSGSISRKPVPGQAM